MIPGLVNALGQLYVTKSGTLPEYPRKGGFTITPLGLVCISLVAQTGKLVQENLGGILLESGAGFILWET